MQGAEGENGESREGKEEEEEEKKEEEEPDGDRVRGGGGKWREAGSVHCWPMLSTTVA